MIDKMTKYSFILLSGKTETFLERLQQLGLVDITRSRKPIDAESGAIWENAKEIKKVISILRKADFSKSPDAAAIEKTVQSIVLPDDSISYTKDTVADIERLKARYSSLRKEETARQPWGEFETESLKKISDAGYVIRYYSVPKKKFKEEWSSLYPLQIISETQSNIWFITVAGRDEEYDFPVESVPAPAGSWKDAQKEAEAVNDELILKYAALLKLKERIPVLEEEYANELTRLDLYLADSGKTLAAEDMITVFEGFAPEENEAALCEEFDKMDIIYLKSKAVEEDNPPIKLKNNRFARMFEVLTGMYGMPVYGEFDPTPILGPFFLLFFSMCMGDAGYGILLVLIGMFLKKSSGSMAKISSLVITLGIGTFFVGIVLGTFFGINLAESSWVPSWLKKCMITGEIAGYSSQMVLAICIGIFHICLAMTVKAIGYTCRFGFRNTVSTWGWLLLIVGGIVIAGLAFLGVMSEPVVKWAVIILGIISGLGIYIFNTPGRNPLINIGSGLWETYNMATGLLGDVLSYLRLYALGLAGGMLGNAFNNLAGMLLDGIPVPGLNWLGFIVILILGHALNLAMSCLGAFVHPLRLTFVEYFKNSGYEGKGTAYNPLVLKKSTDE